MVQRMLAVGFLLMLATVAANAADQPAAGITGLFVTTKYPALTVRAGETTTIDLSVRNFRLPPQLLSLGVPQAADGWKATILGGGQPVGAVEVAPDSEERLQLRLEPPAGIGHGEYRFTVEAKNAQYDDKLPIAVTIGEEVPAKLKLATNFPALRGTATTSFKYKVAVTNDSPRRDDQFQRRCAEELSDQLYRSLWQPAAHLIPIEAGKSKDVEATLTIPRDSPAGDWLVLRAKTGRRAPSSRSPDDCRPAAPGALGPEGGSPPKPMSARAAADRDPAQYGSQAARGLNCRRRRQGWKSNFDPKRWRRSPPARAWT
jgi:hypothetical protein